MEKITKLRKLINYYGLDGYIIPKNDEFFNEYVAPFKDRLKFISNFSGSFGFALIFKKNNYLFVDGRYTLQAKIQSGNKFKIFTIPNQLPIKVIKKKKLKIGFDPKLHTEQSLKYFFNKTNCDFVSINQNLVDKLMIKKKNIVKKFYILPKKAVDQDFKIKIGKCIKILKEKNIDLQLVTSSENVAWLLNIRGHDTEYSPLTNAYIILEKNGKVNFFCDPRKLNDNFKRKFQHISFTNITNLKLFLSRKRNKTILIDSSTCSIYLKNSILSINKIIQSVDPINFIKAVKTKKEIKNNEKSHIYDGVALTKFLFWLYKNYKNYKITEISAQEKLLKFRQLNKNFIFPSFPTISGSGPNGSIIHYKASKKSNRKLKEGDIYLVDSGGQYNFGTTDVTRTISLSNDDYKIKNIFTRVLKGHIAVANFKIKKNTNGSKIDIVARKPLKKIRLDFPHGTGHGVGYFLNVHEGPQAITKNNKVNFKEGMIVSNEPGYYEDGKFGIRIENLLVVKKDKKNLKFENLTMVPIDKSLINKKILEKKEVNWLNTYHMEVFNKLKKFMNKLELIELKKACSKI